MSKPTFFHPLRGGVLVKEEDIKEQIAGGLNIRDKNAEVLDVEEQSAENQSAEKKNAEKQNVEVGY
tara:strand:- start:166 stop:363 length:198 start_codon:yes stop_codon:yes gene_type:complete